MAKAGKKINIGEWNIIIEHIHKGGYGWEFDIKEVHRKSESITASTLSSITPMSGDQGNLKIAFEALLFSYVNNYFMPGTHFRITISKSADATLRKNHLYYGSGVIYKMFQRD
jgi:hypothetical protein